MYRDKMYRDVTYWDVIVTSLYPKSQLDLMLTKLVSRLSLALARRAGGLEREGGQCNGGDLLRALPKL